MLGITQGTLSKSAEKLSSGYKVNRAADDAAGLSISEKMRKQIRGLTQASSNAEDGISAVQTAEGALTEVHDMLQRMNELAVKAATGTMSESDRQAVQDEVEQLLTEVDRVAETTKFNETYLLKGDKKEVDVYLKAHDAGITGTLTEGATTATLSVKELKVGDTCKIGNKEFAIGDTKDKIKAKITGAKEGMAVEVDGQTYTVAGIDDANDEKYILSAADIAKKVQDKSTVKVNGKTYEVYDDSKKDTVLTTEKAYAKMVKELTLANNVGVDINDTDDGQGSAATPTKRTATDGTVYYDFKITKGKVKTNEKLNFSLHVGADADMSNKIIIGIDNLTTEGLGIKNLNVNDSYGRAATYAIDAVADAVAKISAQRSALGAVQNRLEHTIKNLDNVVENTTAAESQIRDTDMANEMVKYSNNNILSQAGMSMLAQSNQVNQGVLSLIG